MTFPALSNKTRDDSGRIWTNYCVTKSISSLGLITVIPNPFLKAGKVIWSAPWEAVDSDEWARRLVLIHEAKVLFEGKITE